jgi:hypothetical protein
VLSNAGDIAVKSPVFERYPSGGPVARYSEALNQEVA